MLGLGGSDALDRAVKMSILSGMTALTAMGGKDVYDAARGGGKGEEDGEAKDGVEGQPFFTDEVALQQTFKAARDAIASGLATTRLGGKQLTSDMKLMLTRFFEKRLASVDDKLKAYQSAMGAEAPFALSCVGVSFGDSEAAEDGQPPSTWARARADFRRRLANVRAGFARGAASGAAATVMQVGGAAVGAAAATLGSAASRLGGHRQAQLIGEVEETLMNVAELRSRYIGRLESQGDRNKAVFGLDDAYLVEGMLLLRARALIGKHLPEIAYDGLSRALAGESLLTLLQKGAIVTFIELLRGAHEGTETNFSAVLAGEAGVGKTTMANGLSTLLNRLLVVAAPAEKTARLMELVKRGDADKIDDDEEWRLPAVNASPNDLIAGYTGQTAGKTRAFLTRNYGRVVVLDEFHSVSGGFASDALSELAAFVSRHPESSCFLYAGYPTGMVRVVEQDEGLARRIRFRYLLTFEHTAAELSTLVLGIKHDDADAKTRLSHYLYSLSSSPTKFILRSNYASLAAMVRDVSIGTPVEVAFDREVRDRA